MGSPEPQKAAQAPACSSNDITGQPERRAKPRESGILTDEAFQEQKPKILSR